jgi:adenylate kinase family enzyme
MAVMRRVAVFGNAGGGKSTLARRLAEITGLPLYVIDIIQYHDGRYRDNEPNGGKMPRDVYEKLHADIIGKDAWIIDGFDDVALAWKRFDAADTLIHVDLPISTHYWGVTKRLAQGLFNTPRGWPENTPVWESSFDSYRVIWLCHTRLTPKYRQLVASSLTKQVHHLRSYLEMTRFLQAIQHEYSERPATALHAHKP